ncbi:MAG: hypothetical protein HY791_04105 [Deltaproteobacteria bacterium]|nr:hypothetical protein [Deltaproteobacteria bacterium]
MSSRASRRKGPTSFAELSSVESFLGPELLRAIRDGAERVVIEDLPNSLELEARERLRFRYGQAVRARTRELEALGFERFADHRASALKVTRLRSMIHPRTHVFATIYDQDGTPVGLSALLEDGTRLSVTTVPRRTHLAEPLHHETHWIVGLDPAALLSRFFELKMNRPIKPLRAKDYVGECQRAWIERVSFLKERAFAPSLLGARTKRPKKRARGSA